MCTACLIFCSDYFLTRAAHDSFILEIFNSMVFIVSIFFIFQLSLCIPHTSCGTSLACFRKMGSGLANAASATLECKRLCNLVVIRKCLDSTTC